MLLGFTRGGGHRGPQFEAPPASTLEALVAGNRQMAALATEETPVRQGRHRPEFVSRDAVWTPNHRRIHGDIHDGHLPCPTNPPP
jgi:hypothetical protein